MHFLISYKKRKPFKNIDLFYIGISKDPKVWMSDLNSGLPGFIEIL